MENIYKNRKSFSSYMHDDQSFDNIKGYHADCSYTLTKIIKKNYSKLSKKLIWFKEPNYEYLRAYIYYLIFNSCLDNPNEEINIWLKDFKKDDLVKHKNSFLKFNETSQQSPYKKTNRTFEDFERSILEMNEALNRINSNEWKTNIATIKDCFYVFDNINEIKPGDFLAYYYYQPNPEKFYSVRGSGHVMIIAGIPIKIRDIKNGEEILYKVKIFDSTTTLRTDDTRGTWDTGLSMGYACIIADKDGKIKSWRSNLSKKNDWNKV